MLKLSPIKILHKASLLLQLYCVAAAAYIVWPPASVLVLFCIAVQHYRRRVSQLTTLGSARWAEPSDLRNAGMVGARSGLILGRLPVKRTVLQRLAGASSESDELIRLHQAVHTAVFAPTGVGKGVSISIPALLASDQSAVVVDPKAEHAAATAEHRRKKFGHRIVLLDPYRKFTQKPDAFNPLDFIPADAPLALDDCNDLANALVVRSGEEKEPHWNDSAEAYISAIAATVVAYGEKDSRSLQTVRDILSHPQKLDMAIKLMTESDRWGGALAPMGGQLLHFADKEKSSVLSSAMRHLRFLGTPAIAESTRSSTFDPAELRAGRMTVYLILPPDRAHAQSGLLRMWIGSMLRACVRGGLQ